MPESQNMVVRISVKDEATPVLKSIQRRLWWMRYGEAVALAVLTGASFVAGLVAGLQF